ncbi:hypothetical protein IHE44_0011220 [Lamprotornis superbus]|uniref:SMC hinge domain-containing protein n=1 Tax=Lamprotornis superbus TaxID=245042 RepID=A0A835NJ84_9PASS|nr:hypothetical protein IHE44_0011220 [Lamprotornis superbus]
MYIKSIVLEGFKSYAQRIEIHDFDPLFNASTGLNGSGKSNILDSICFVLGISNLSQVRASNLQDLVYKSGQAGITKATVSINFDNSDKSRSPLGFEANDEITVTRQVVVGGRSKYLINFFYAANSRVQDLFCSVGLNVNNPHFLIMQGQITKVLNMKPPEILAMIEEAAGTRMYECKKIAVQKTIEKKESKLKSIQTVLNEEISPTLQKLKEERASYLEYQKLVREIEHLSRFCVAYQFVLAEETKVSSTDILKEMQSNVEKFQESRAEIQQKVKQLSEDIAEMEKEKDKEVGGRLCALEAALSEDQRVNTKARSALDLKKQNLKSEELKYNELITRMQKDSKANKDGEEATLSGQMMICKNEISKAVTEAKQAQMKLNYAQKELKAKEAEFKKINEGYKKDRKAFEAVEQIKTTLEKQIKELNYSEEKGEALLAKKKALVSDISRLRELSENLMAKFPHLQFTYKHPEKNWNLNHVKGPVVSLFTVKDLSNAKALEAVAGGKLYNIIVDTEAGHANLHLALSLIVYESELQKAMEYVFGTTLVCNNMDNAKKLTFDKRMMRSASSQAVPILSKLQEVKAVEIELKKKESELADVENELASLKTVAVMYQQLKQQWEMKSEEAELLQKKLQQSAYHKQEEELLALRQTIGDKCEVKALVLELEELKQEQASYKQQITAAEEAIKSYQDQIDAMVAEVAKTQESVERAEKELAKQKEVIALHDNAIKEKSAEMVKYREQNNELQLKVKELEHSITKCQQDAADAAAKVAKMLKEYKWIASDKPLFGQPNTAYDFKSNNPKEASQRLQKLQEHIEKLGRNVNTRAMNMLSDAEERYNDLMKKKRIVENDKIKILAVIEELDRKKKQALEIAWKKVNEDFGSIFSTLLPGARAMLAATKTHNVFVGMEFRVALGQTWKENLTELSGGQRPAPVYILDEFIVVSLKDGMFNNANVLYKTRFVDGVSTIARYSQNQNRKKESAFKKPENSRKILEEVTGPADLECSPAC